LHCLGVTPFAQREVQISRQSCAAQPVLEVNRQSVASIVRIVWRRLALQFGGSKIRCILTLRASAADPEHCNGASLRQEHWQKSFAWAACQQRLAVQSGGGVLV